MKKRFIALLLCLCMALTILPAQVFAQEGGDAPLTPATNLLKGIYISAEDDNGISPKTRLEVNADKIQAEDTFNFPAQPGKKGTITITKTYSDVAVKVEQNNQIVNDGTSWDEPTFLSLDAGQNITITATKGDKINKYIINLTPGDADVPKFNSSPITDAGFTLTPAFSPDQREYVLRVPSDAKALSFRADPNAGDDYRGRQFWFDLINAQGEYMQFDSFNGYWHSQSDVGPVPLEHSELGKAFNMIVTVGDKYVRQEYLFRIVRDEPSKAELPDFLFGINNFVQYDGKPHSKDLLYISPLLDESKLTLTFDDVNTPQVEKLSEVTEVADYYVYISYEGDATYAPVEDKQLCSPYNGTPIYAHLGQAVLEVKNTLTTDNELSLPYSPFYAYSDLNIPGLTVIGLDNKPVEGSWNIFRKDGETGFNALADFTFADSSMNRNYYVPGVPLKITRTERILSSNDIQLEGFDDETSKYTYSPYGYIVPQGYVQGLGNKDDGIIQQNWYVDGTEYKFFATKYSIFNENDEDVSGERDENGMISSPPRDVGKYKLRVSIPKDSLHTMLQGKVDFAGGANEIYKDIPYEIVPQELCPKVRFTTRLLQNGMVSVYPVIEGVEEGLPEAAHNFFSTELKVGDTVIPRDQYGYKDYEMDPNSSDPVTFTIGLNDKYKNNYSLSEDSVLTVTLSPKAETLTPRASSNAIVVHKYDNKKMASKDEFTGRIELDGKPADKDVYCEISQITLTQSTAGSCNATVNLILRGEDAGDYILSASSVTVPATIEKLVLSDPDISVELHSSSYSYYQSTDKPFEPEVTVYAPSGGGIPPSQFKVSYLNNMLPSVQGGENSGIFGKAVVTAAENSSLTGSVVKEFFIENKCTNSSNSGTIHNIKKGEKTELLIDTTKPLELKWDDQGAIKVQAEDPVNGKSKVTIEALRTGEAILMVKRFYEEYGSTYYGFQLFGVVVTDGGAPAEPVPSTIFAGALTDPAGAIRGNLINVKAEAGTGKEEDGLGFVTPVTVSGQMYPIDKEGYKFRLNAIPGYQEANGYKLAVGKNAGELNLDGKTVVPLDAKVTNSRSGMTYTFIAPTSKDMKDLTGTMVRLQWYKDGAPLGQYETYRLNLGGLQINTEISIDSVKMYSTTGIVDGITATADNKAGIVVLTGKAPAVDNRYCLQISTSLYGWVNLYLTIKPGDGENVTYALENKYKDEFITGPDLTDDEKGFYLLNRPYKIDVSGIQKLPHVAAPATSGKVADNITGVTPEQKKELEAVVSGSTSSGLTAAVVADGKGEVAPVLTEENKAALQEAIGDEYIEDDVKAVIQPYLDITVTGYENKNGERTLSVNIDAMCRTVVTTAGNPSEANSVKVVGETAEDESANAVVVGTPQKVPVDTPITISLKLPYAFTGGSLRYIYVKHKKNGQEYYYYASVNNQGVATFTSTHGLSPFELDMDFQPEAKSQAVGAPENTALYYESLQSAIEAAGDGDIIEIMKAPASSQITAKIGSDKTLTFKLAAGVNVPSLTINGVQITPTEAGTDAVIAKKTDSQNNNQGGGTYPSETYEVKASSSTGGGRVTVAPGSAGKGAIVTITVTPDEGYELAGLTVTGADGKAVETTGSGNKYTFIMPAGAVTIDAAFKPAEGPVWENPFSDVKAGKWYYDAVRYASENNLMIGSAGKFSPDKKLTRSEFAQILYRKEGSPAVSGDSGFSDVPANTWYTKPMAWATNRGILLGYANGKAGPGDAITREQLASLLWRYEGSPAPKATELDFPDAGQVSGWAKEAMLWAVENEVLKGKSGSGGLVLDPKGSATRAETAQMLMNYLKK